MRSSMLYFLASVRNLKGRTCSFKSPVSVIAMEDACFPVKFMIMLLSLVEFYCMFDHQILALNAFTYFLLYLAVMLFK
mgnify:CR=1 FL=1